MFSFPLCGPRRPAARLPPEILYELAMSAACKLPMQKAKMRHAAASHPPNSKEKPC